MPSSESVFAVTRADFTRQVLDASRDRPILVDFWASWCGPCRALAPVLEQLANAHPGKLAIAKVDTDAEPELAGEYGIRSLPTVMLFKDGARVDQLSGAHPLGTLQEFLAPYLERDSDRLIALGRAAQAAGRADEAIATLEQALASDPDNQRIHPVLTAMLLDADKLDRAAAVLRELPANVQSTPEIARLETRLRWAAIVRDAPPAHTLTDATDTPSRYLRGIHAAAAGDYTAALADLLEVVRVDRRYGNDAARKAMIDIFNLLDADDPLLRQYRTTLARALN